MLSENGVGFAGFNSALVIFLGDYCDRGPETRKVIDFLISLPEKHPDQTHVFLAGNHNFSFAGFLGLLPRPSDGSDLKDPHGCSATVIADRETGRSRGFGFVSFDSEDSANTVVTEMDGKELNGRNIHVNLANERSSAPRSSFGGGGGGGGGGGYSGGSSGGF